MGQSWDAYGKTAQEEEQGEEWPRWLERPKSTNPETHRNNLNNQRLLDGRKFEKQEPESAKHKAFRKSCTHICTHIHVHAVRKACLLRSYYISANLELWAEFYFLTDYISIKGCSLNPGGKSSSLAHLMWQHFLNQIYLQMHLTGNAYLIFLSSTCQDKSKAESLEKGIPTTDSKPPGDLMSKERQKEKKKLSFVKQKRRFT